MPSKQKDDITYKIIEEKRGVVCYIIKVMIFCINPFLLIIFNYLVWQGFGPLGSLSPGV